MSLILTDLSDYLAPSQACIKPINEVKLEPKEDSKAYTEIVIGGDGQVYEENTQGAQEKLQKAQITLNDCLACSGCITSAESILVAIQSHEQVYDTIRTHPELTRVLSFAPQSIASLAAVHGLSNEECLYALRAFFRVELGFRLVFDTSFSNVLSLLEQEREFAESNGRLLLSSSCPGWICYAEKTHGELLPFISQVKSALPVMGWLAKYGPIAAYLGVRPQEIYHVSVMPCYDKKLEASRSDFESEGVKDVDTVLTTGEVLQMLRDKNATLADYLGGASEGSDNAALPNAGGSVAEAKTRSVLHAALDASNAPLSEEQRILPQLVATPGSSSGGSLHHIISKLLSTLSAEQLARTRVVEERGRNDDYRDYLVVSMEADKPKVLLHAAKCYGFRNLQNVVRKIVKDNDLKKNTVAAAAGPYQKSAAADQANARRRERMAARMAARKPASADSWTRDLLDTPYQYIEVMACPSGCVNGGGQAPAVRDANSLASFQQDWINTVENQYRVSFHRSETAARADVHPSVLPYLETREETRASILNQAKHILKAADKTVFMTEYHAVESEEINGLAVKW